MKICAHRLIDVEGDDRKQTASVIDGPCWPAQTFSIQAPRFHSAPGCVVKMEGDISVSDAF
jgi:hypothetical protein